MKKIRVGVIILILFSCSKLQKSEGEETKEKLIEQFKSIRLEAENNKTEEEAVRFRHKYQIKEFRVDAFYMPQADIKEYTRVAKFVQSVKDDELVIKTIDEYVGDMESRDEEFSRRFYIMTYLLCFVFDIPDKYQTHTGEWKVFDPSKEKFPDNDALTYLSWPILWNGGKVIYFRGVGEGRRAKQGDFYYRLYNERYPYRKLD